MTTMAQQSYETDTFTTPDGKSVSITFIKHGTLMIRVNDSYTLHIDPVINLEPKSDYTRFSKADLILVTHEHYDHYDTLAIKQITKSNTTLVTNERVARMQGYGKVMKNGDKITIDGIELTAVAAYNITKGHTQFHPKGRDNGFVIAIGGLHIYVSGDTEDIPELKNLKGIDIAFLSANQPYTMTPEQCIKAAKTFRPKILYPYHYGDTDVQKIVEGLKGSGIEVRVRDLK